MSWKIYRFAFLRKLTLVHVITAYGEVEEFLYRFLAFAPHGGEISPSCTATLFSGTGPRFAPQAVWALGTNR
jgi:hypothetical protein